MSASPPPPATAASVQRREGKKAQESIPDVSIELFRVWLPDRSRAEIEARRSRRAFLRHIDRVLDAARDKRLIDRRDADRIERAAERSGIGG